jgi:hypothetical protein
MNHKKLTDDEYNAMTVPELRDLAEERGIDVPSSATKAEIIAALKGGKASKDAGADDAAEDERNKAGAKEVEAQINAAAWEDFEDPVIDGSKPVIDQTTPTNVVTILVFDGSNVPTMPEDGKDYDHLVFVQSGRSQEFLLPEPAKRKFVQDRTGQIFYNSHGVAGNDEFKPVDIVALGT